MSNGSSGLFALGKHGTKLEIKCLRHVSGYKQTVQGTDDSGSIFVMRFIALGFGTRGCFLETELLPWSFFDIFIVFVSL